MMYKRSIGLLLLIVLVVACGPANSPAPANTPGATPWLAETVAPVPAATDTNQPAATATSQPAATATSQPDIATATSQPDIATATSQPATPLRLIVLETPQSGMVVRSPVLVRGRVSVTPFEATLVARVYDAQGRLVGEAPITMATEMGQPGPFEGQVPFQAAATGPGRVEVAEMSAKDGSIVVSAGADVVLESEPASTGIEIPAAGERVTLPLHILARVGQPGEQVTASLRWQDGTELTQTFTALRGEDGRGLIVNGLDWMMESQPPQPASQPATLELRAATGTVLARQNLQVLSHDDPDVRQVTLYFLLGEQLQATQRNIVRTEGIGAATLQELLWGPPVLNLAGFETALPTPQEVLAYPAREPDWGPRVTLLKLTIVDGVATADFSQEMWAYAGGSLRVMLIRQQIEQTLRQFSTVQEVRIAIEGDTEAALQP